MQERKNHFIIGGVKEEIFRTTIGNPLSTVNDFVPIDTRIEWASSSGICHHQRFPESNSLENSYVSTSINDYIKQVIRDIVPEELRKFQAQSASISTLSFPGDVMPEKVQQAMGTVPGARAAAPPPLVSYAAADQRPTWRSLRLRARRAPQPRRNPPTQHQPQRYARRSKRKP